MDIYSKGRGSTGNPRNRFDRLSHEWEPEFAETHPSEFRELSNPRTRCIAVFPKRIVNTVHSPDLPMRYSLNPYQGCEHGCAYCYARDTHAYWGYSPGMDFENTILYKPTAPQWLHRQLSSRNWVPEAIMLSGNTDCYQPVERRFRITRRCLEVLLAHRHPVSIITKNALILRDTDILAELGRQKLVQVVVSVTTSNEDLRRDMEPRTASYARRLDLIARLSDLGVPTSAFMAPIIPGLNSHEILRIGKEAAQRGAWSFDGTLLRLNGSVEKVFTDWLQRVRPGESDKVLALLRSCHEGKLGETRPGLRMKGSGQVAQQILQLIRLTQQKYFSHRAVPELRQDLYLRNPAQVPGCGDGGTGQLSLFDF